MNRNHSSIYATGFLAVMLVVLAAGTMSCSDKKASGQGSAGTPTKVTVGTLAVAAPVEWRLVSGSEESQVKSEVKQGVDQMIEKYRVSTGRLHPEFGIQDLKALRLPGDSGWCILHLLRLPPQSDYYSTMAEDNKQKLDWGLSQGIFDRVVENGTVKVGPSTIMKTIVCKKDGGRMITLIHWSPKKPTDVTQLMVIESKYSQSLSRQVDDLLASLEVTEPN